MATCKEDSPKPYSSVEALCLNETSAETPSWRPLTSFIRKYCTSTSNDNGSSNINKKDIPECGQTFKGDFATLCNQTPYCLYVYHGVQLDDNKEANVVLLGFFDKASGENKIRLLDVVHPMIETAGDICTYIKELLKMLKVPLLNMTMVYSDFPDPKSLKMLRPGIVLLHGLADLANRVCHSGVEKMDLCDSIQNLISEIYKHIPSFPADLQLLLEDVDSTNSKDLASRIQKISFSWSELEAYFGSLETDERSIGDLLKNPKLRLNFLFLSHALQPLIGFQDHVTKGAKVTKLLEKASQLLRTYTAKFLRPKAAEYFHRRGKTSLLQESVGHLPRGEVAVGEQAGEFSRERSEDLSGYLDVFHNSVISFYTTVTVNIVEHLPVSDSTIRSLLLMLSPGKKIEVTGKMVQDLGVSFGICLCPENVSLLSDEFLEYQLIDVANNDYFAQSFEQYWQTELNIIGKLSNFARLIVGLLALPTTLKRDVVFDLMFQQADYLKMKKNEDLEEKVNVEEDSTDSSSYKTAPSHLSSETQESLTSDLIDLTEMDDLVLVEDISPMEVDDVVSVSSDSDIESQTGGYPQLNIIVVDDYDDGVDGDDDDDDEVTDDDDDYNTGGYKVGELVWRHIKGFGHWPVLIQSWDKEDPCGSTRKIVFFGNKIKSEVASRRSRMFFSPHPDTKDELFQVMLDWALGGFQPLGPDALQTQKEEKISRPRNGKSATEDHKANKLLNLSVSLGKLPESLVPNSGSINLQTPDICKKSLLSKCNQRSVEKVKKHKKPKKQNKNLKNNQPVYVESRHNSQKRYQMVHEFLKNERSIEDFCLACGSVAVEIIHPLFEGKLCSNCKVNFTETLYRYDEDGFQSYCTVCCSGMEVILCGHNNCCRSFCLDCLDILVGEGTFDRLKNVDPWTCYLCAPESSLGALKARHDWSIRVQEFFANDSAMEFEPHRVYPSIPANQRRPIRVLSLFDGIATGYLVLRDLGFKVEQYVASEVDEESITIAMVNHNGKITHVDDVKNITKNHIEKWGPFDLLIGGSPCNDLSIVNPARKGLYEGTGRLFFEFYRLLNVLRPKDDDPRPFFWLFENVTFMQAHVKADICRFLECNPVLVDSVKVSPAHRARYFWGNIPGMNRLQQCLEPGRTAKYEKIRTITTKKNSLNQGCGDIFPVTMNGKDDIIWITELEKIFGFPKHYTDVKNMGRPQRQKVLGKSWSVPVFNIQAVTVTIDNEPFTIRLFDTAVSFESVKEKWVPEITYYSPKTPFLLVGTQIDLRDDPVTIARLAKNKQKPIKVETAEKLARELKAVKYVECSAMSHKGLVNVFEEAILAVVDPPLSQNICKCVLS
ncbi:hypothetical protein DNTS_030355 [Danionella cerebrum]|uniref:DNA (cytosine-5-)-methyltransferase n=1 Tax=Danionella cerebrum TaxID=2873325 RepID=A0A553QIX9_9TELE|nr:hypothetical protein DNTS_030355 [Danionella translucida]